MQRRRPTSTGARKWITVRAKSNPIIVTAMTTAALISALSACTTIPGYPDDLITSPTTSVQSAHVWTSDGYSWIIVADGNTAQTFETTQISCLPSHTLGRAGAPAADGTVEYGTDGIAAETLRPARTAPLRCTYWAARPTSTCCPYPRSPRIAPNVSPTTR